MLHSLRFRLLMTMLLVLVVAVGVYSLIASRATTREFYHYVEYDDTTRLERFVDMLATYYTQQQTWADAQALINQMGEITGARIALVDNEGSVIAASDESLLGDELVISEEEGGTIEVQVWVQSNDPRDMMTQDGTLPQERSFRLNDQETVGTVYVDRINPQEDSFIQSVNRALLVGIVATGIIAVILTLVISRQIVKPLEALTQAARQMEKGNLNQRVLVTTKDEVGTLGHAFNAMADGLVRLEQLRRNMVTDVAHELRTPLSNIRGYLEAIQDGVIDPTPELVESLHEETMHLNHLVDTLQELALAEAGKLHLNRRPLDVNELFGKCLAGLQPRILEKSLTIACDTPDALPHVYADPERVSQIVRNLLNNAITHTPSQGSITLKARQTDPANLQIDVIDTGTGIAPEHIENIFERFYRADASRNRYTGGVGLGLSIVKQLVEAHEGRVWVNSKPNAGAIFSFTLPIL